MKGTFDSLTGLFDRVGLQKNVRKMVRMLFCLCHAVGTQFEAAYERQMTGERLTYRDCHKLWVQCPDRGVNLVAGSLAVHWQMQHAVYMGVGVGYQWENPLPPAENPKTYLMSFPRSAGPRECPVKECMGSEANRMYL